MFRGYPRGMRNHLAVKAVLSLFVASAGAPASSWAAGCVDGVGRSSCGNCLQTNCSFNGCTWAGLTCIPPQKLDSDAGQGKSGTAGEFTVAPGESGPAQPANSNRPDKGGRNTVKTKADLDPAVIQKMKDGGQTFDPNRDPRVMQEFGHNDPRLDPKTGLHGMPKDIPMPTKGSTPEDLAKSMGINLNRGGNVLPGKDVTNPGRDQMQGTPTGIPKTKDGTLVYPTQENKTAVSQKSGTKAAGGTKSTPGTTTNTMGSQIQTTNFGGAQQQVQNKQTQSYGGQTPYGGVSRDK